MTIPWHKRNNDPHEQYQKALKMREMRTTRRYAKMMGAPITELIDRDIVYLRDKGICGICKEAVSKDDYDMDHKIPLSRGGSHTYENVHTTHSKCNRSKSNKTLEELNL